VNVALRGREGSGGVTTRKTSADCTCLGTYVPVCLSASSQPTRLNLAISLILSWLSLFLLLILIHLLIPSALSEVPSHGIVSFYIGSLISVYFNLFVTSLLQLPTYSTWSYLHSSS